MSELDTIDFLCSSCSCKLQVPAAMAGVSGPCPNCNSSITAPLPAAAVLPATPPVALLTPPAEIATLPPKKLPEHIPATTIRATAQLIRQSTQADEPVDKPKIKCRGFILEASAPELSHESVRPSRPRLFRFVVPSAFAAVASVVALAVLHSVGMVDLRNHQNSFKTVIKEQEKPTAPSPNSSVLVSLPKTKAKSDAPIASVPKTTEPKTAIPTTSAKQESDAPPASSNPVKPDTQLGADTVKKPLAKKSPSKTSEPPVIASTQPKKPVQETQARKVNPIMANIMEKGEFPELKLSPSAPKQKQSPSSKPEPAPVPTVGYLADENIEAFLATKTLDERLPYLLKGTRLPNEMQSTSLARPFKPVKSVRLLETRSGAETNMVEHLYMVKFEDPAHDGNRLNLLVLLVERIGKHPPLINADAFLEHYDNKLAEYALKPNPEAATFHCIAEARTSDFANELPTEIRQSLIRFTVKTHPYYPAKFNAYLSKNSPLMSHVGSGKSFPYTTSKYCILSFKWNTTHPEHPYIELSEVVNSSGWEWPKAETLNQQASSIKSDARTSKEWQAE